MNAAEVVAALAIDLVPQWIRPSQGSGNGQLQIADRSFPFQSLRDSTRELTHFKRVVEGKAPRWVTWLEEGQPPSARALIQEAFAIEWLNILAPAVDWHKAIAYTTGLSLRTFENAALTSNLVISGGSGTVDVTEPSQQKLIDPLAGSPQTFLRVDGNLRLMSYEAIPWNSVRDAEDYKLVPEFLHPFSSILQTGDVSIHHTSRGDLLIMKRGGLRAARRKGQWRIYDPSKLKDCISDLLKNYWVGANVFEFLLDLSFKRHGALLVYDPQHRLLADDRIVNRASIIAPGTESADPCRQALREAVGKVRMGHKNGLTGAKRLMIELASLDGAVVFDADKILTIGAMIATQPRAGGHAGARTTAARSALAFGAHPIKVSTDGDIEILFDNGAGVERLSFL